MAFALIFVGIILAVSAVRGTHGDLFGLIHDDFTGPHNYLYWVVVVLAIGSIGYIKPLRPLSRAFLVLIVFALVLSKGDPKKAPGGGLFAQLLTQFGAGTSGAADKANLSPAQMANVAGGLPPLPDFAAIFKSQ